MELHWFRQKRMAQMRGEPIPAAPLSQKSVIHTNELYGQVGSPMRGGPAESPIGRCEMNYLVFSCSPLIPAPNNLKPAWALKGTAVKLPYKLIAACLDNSSSRKRYHVPYSDGFFLLGFFYGKHFIRY